MIRFLLSLPVICATALAQTEAPTFHADKLSEIEAAVRLAITEGRTPGGVIWVERNGAVDKRAIGERAKEPAREAITEDTIYDAASLTKVLSTTPAMLKLIEQGKIDLEAAVSKYLPEFADGAKAKVTVRHLMTHSSGTKPGIGGGWEGYEKGIAKACAEPLAAEPGTVFRYSDINFILLGDIVKRVSGKALNEYVRDEIFGPLKMTDTMYLPPATLKGRIAPTTRETERGVVHDPTARRMGGVAGHAGLFTTAADTARFCRMMLNGGELEGARIFKPETVKLMTSVQSPANLQARRGLGWDIDTSYSGPRGRWMPLGSYGHTGWTGTSMWIDPFSKTFVLVMSNRNHPTENGSVIGLRREIGTLAAESVAGFNFLHVPGALQPTEVTITEPPRALSGRNATVLTGIDVLVRDKFAPLRGLRVGLITNHTGADSRRRRTIDLLAKAEGVTLAAIFSPEHGIAGKLDEKVGDTKDEPTGLAVWSLYGESRTPKPEQLENLDALVFDIQDIGCRFYTYTSTMGECLTAAAKAKKKFFVLDRPNPIGGFAVEGPVRDGEGSFVAWHDIPVRHGMTLGELAKMFNEERKLGADLTVIACEGWTRGLWYDETGLPWINQSPNMRSLTAAALYPGVGLIEFTNVSVGRGTDKPFEYVGAPYVNDQRLAAKLNAQGLPGVRFVPVRFTPTASVNANKECGGVQILVTDRRSLNAVDVGLEIARALESLYGKEWNEDKMVKLLVDPKTLKGVQELRELSSIRAEWVPKREEFAKRREKFLIYQ